MSPKIDTLLLDCDNTLVLSEPLAFAACAELANELLGQHGIQANYTGPALLSEFVGQNFRGMVLSLLNKYNLTIPPTELETWVSREENAVIAKLYESLVPCDGVKEALANVLKQNIVELAVVSSSALRRVKASLEKVDIHDLFGDRVFSAATSLPKPTSKPDPAIYNFAVEKLGKTKEQCLAVEDSKSGTLSARNAGIRVLGYVGSYEEHERGEMSQVLKAAGAEVVMTHWDEFEPILAKL